MLSQIVSALGVVVVAVFACSAYFFFSNKILDLALPVKDGDIRQASRNLNRRAMIRPWLFLFPALFLLIVYLVYPVVATFILSFYDRSGNEFVGAQNYLWALNDREFRQSIFNNILWLAVVPACCTFFGLVIAVMTDRIWWGNIAKSIVFMPMAISFVGASVIWKFIYEYRGGNDVQIGLLNAIVQTFGGTPEVWISVPFWNNFFLMVILVWIQTGFAMVILSAALARYPGGDDRGSCHRWRQWLADLLAHHGAADLGHDRRRLDDDHHPCPQGLRYRAHHDQRPVADHGAGEPDVQLVVPRRRRFRPKCRHRHHHHARRHADHGVERAPRQRRTEGALR